MDAKVVAIILFFTHFILITCDTSTIVECPLGKIQGSTLVSRKGNKIFAFRGIRYAKAPINDLRFQQPVPVDKWNDVYNATEDGPVCPQPTQEITSEDCLFLNVYSSKLPAAGTNVSRPVLVYFHAGGWYSGTGASPWAGPEYLLDQDVVLVTLNYRLATLGFLSTGTKEAPGNNGLKDQVLALKWVRDNILSFGGSPDSVTIMGYSAGGASVTLHLVSPMSRGLFHRAIIQSGSSLGQWPIANDLLGLAKKQARFVGCTADGVSVANLVGCLKNVSAEDLGNSLEHFYEFGFDPILIWEPVIETDFGQERFLIEHPVESVSKGNFSQVPVLAGITTFEFSYHAFDVLDNETLKNEMDSNFNKIAPISFIYDRDTEESRKISDELRKFYFGERNIDNSTRIHLMNLYADGVTGFGVNRAIKLLASRNTDPAYYYRFDYKGRYSHYYLPDNTTLGPVHHDDLIYLFYVQRLFPFFKLTDPESEIVDKLTLLWANFAKTGNPTPCQNNDTLDNLTWTPFNSETQKFLNINKKLDLYERLYGQRYETWENAFPLNMS